MSSQVTHPIHYNQGKIECIEFLEDQDLGFHLGNVVKYVVRAGKKDSAKTIEDLEKAAWYLNRKIELLKAVREQRKPLRPNDMNPKPFEGTDFLRGCLHCGIAINAMYATCEACDIRMKKL